jgi:hypothetical protein
MVRKFPDKQWNHQNSILLHETIRLIGQGQECASPCMTLLLYFETVV